MGASAAHHTVSFLKDRTTAILKAVTENNTWKRMLRNTIATTVTVAITLVHYDTNPIFGRAAYLAAMVTVFAHPGRRVGQLAEALVFVLMGLVVGVVWAVLGLWLASLVIESSPSAGYAIRAVFFVIALMSHGFVRSQIPRAFLFVLLFIIESLQGLTTTSKQVSSTLVANLVYPVLLAAGVILLVNITVFPEFSSTFLGTTTIASLDALADALEKAGGYFVATENDNSVDTTAQTDLNQETSTRNSEPKSQRARAVLSEITASKRQLRSKLNANKNAQNETQFEIAIAHLPPHHLRPISKKAMKRLVSHTIAVVGCCESRFALLGDELSDTAKGRRTQATMHSKTEIDGVDLESVKRKKEIEFGDVRLLRYLLSRIRDPYSSFQKSILQSIGVVKYCVAYAYDVPIVSQKSSIDSDLRLSQLSNHYEEFQLALLQFDTDVMTTLEAAALLQDMKGEELDIMPREEIFLIASFLLNVRQAATQVSAMLECAKLLVQQRSESGSWRRLFMPKIQWKKWLFSGGETDETTPVNERRVAKQLDKKDSASSSKEGLLPKSSHDPEAAGVSKAESNMKTYNNSNLMMDVDSKKLEAETADERSRQSSWPWLRWRNRFVDVLEWIQHSEDVSYAFKLTVATLLVSFPAFVPSLALFYYEHRGSWAALQLIFVFDVAIGTSIYNAYLRAIGTTLGSMWGWAAFSVGNGNAYACAALIFVGLIPSTYVQLGSQYQKAGMVTIVSMCVVALATELQTVPGSGTENFLNRWIAFLIGSVVALIVEVVLLPVKARTRLTEALMATIRRIGDMESCVAYGIEDAAILKEGFSPQVFKRFQSASSKAKRSLDDAETFFPFCSKEPRLKGTFKKMSKIYEEMIFVLRQIVDKMDNMIQLRLAYGSGPLEELNAQIYPYRRNVAGSISLILYAVHEALSTKFPLPQFIPSARLAHLRLVNRIREVVQETASASGSGQEAEKQAIDRILRRKYMSWNASSAAQVEVIEYLEELTDLAKLLVGANEFQSGLLARPTLQDYARILGQPVPSPILPEIALQLTEDSDIQDAGMPSTRQDGNGSSLPISLQRIQSRKQEAGLRKRTSNDERSSKVVPQERLASAVP